MVAGVHFFGYGGEVLKLSNYLITATIKKT